MQPESTKPRPEDNDDAMVEEGKAGWPDNMHERYANLQPNSYARKHADVLLRGIGEFKTRLLRILDGHDEYNRRKNSGTKESNMDRLYQG